MRKFGVYRFRIVTSVNTREDHGRFVSSFFFPGPTGASPLYYFIRIRMQYARQLLESGTAGVKDVAATLGYDARFIFDACLHQSSRLRAAIRGWRDLPG
jgi:methylphosphotriester-DNA--protein-cysteine methyltransferase